MKTLSNGRDRGEVLERVARLRADSQRRWGKMTAHQMVCHLSDSFRMSLGEKFAQPVDNLLTRSLLKWAALWIPVPWVHGFKTRPEVDQQQGGTKPVEFTKDVEELRALFGRFCDFSDEFGAHPIFGRMSRRERMRHGYLHMDHHLRQFGV
jgi:Protein of unknown function (DUF1569)